MTSIASHPNFSVHEKLAEAAKHKKLTPKFIQDTLGLSSPPTVERNASAYVNWNTTLSLLGRAPAKVWFAGVSRPGYQAANYKQSQDLLRDDLSVGVYYWAVTDKLPERCYFWVEVFEEANVLYIDVFDDYKLVAVFDGTPTMNVQIQGGTHCFEGEGLWSRAAK